MDANLQGSRSLHDHLIEQAQMAPFSEREAAVAEYLIDSINDDGYLADWPELSARLLQEFELTVDDLETIVLKIQRSEEHTSELQSLMRISYAVFCLKKKRAQI